MLTLTTQALARVARAVASSESSEEALTAILTAVRASLGGREPPCARPSGSSGDDCQPGAHLPDRPFDPRTLAPDGLASYTLALGGQLEGMLLVGGTAQADAVRDPSLAALLDLAALTLRSTRLGDENARALVANANLTRQADARALVVRAVHDVSLAASGAADLEALAGRLVDHARDLLQVDAAALYWWDEASALLIPLASNHPAANELAVALRAVKVRPASLSASVAQSWSKIIVAGRERPPEDWPTD